MSIYSPIIRDMKEQFLIRVRRWRRQMSGCAWRVSFPDGRVINWISAPYPKTPISLVVFLHEVGHHAIGFDRYPPGFIEEYHVWTWAIERMEEYGVEADQRALHRFNRSMEYAITKALRRGEHVPAEFLHRFSRQMA